MGPVGAVGAGVAVWMVGAVGPVPWENNGAGGAMGPAGPRENDGAGGAVELCGLQNYFCVAFRLFRVLSRSFSFRLVLSCCFPCCLG